MKCAYCHNEVDDTNTSSFSFEGLWFCDLRCWQAKGIRTWRIFRKIPYDPDELPIDEADDLPLFPHDPIWDVERWMKC